MAVFPPKSQPQVSVNIPLPQPVSPPTLSSAQPPPVQPPQPAPPEPKKNRSHFLVIPLAPG